MHDQQSQAKLQLAYPCEWAYVLIGVSEEEMRSAIRHIVADKRHTVAVSNRSARGTYVSIETLVVVRNEEERTHIYHTLQSHPAIKLVL
jgi:putative lipoic acid-binding regulatory protein